ncbi:STIP-like protein [Phytophthora palmivora]|uniref:STIP-like protein n=1 Tax=Phytophthora palmivora TaxID=4796 RepID=A0A2P4YQS2_9STRA|nr:STIP-like protein [Phytophthora palmivora]
MASHGGGMSNADFARMFRKEALHKAVDEDPDAKLGASSSDDTSHELNPMQAAARRWRQEMDSTPADDAPQGSKLGFELSSGSGLGFGSESGSGLGFQPSSGSETGLRVDQKDSAASRAAKTKTYGWEKHTTGFGTKMLAKMGFKGRLGKKEDGVSATIEVKKRPAQMGMGYGDFVEASNLKQNRKLQKELKGESVEQEETVAAEDDTLWRKRKAVPGRRKHKRAVDLAQEVQNMKKQKKSDVVLDMRGPSVRVLSNMTAAYDVDSQRREAAKPKLGDELIYNVRMVVNLAQGKVYDLTQKIEANSENVVMMKKETKLIKAQLNVDDVRLQHMQAMVEQMKALDKLREQALEMQSVELILSHLRTIRRSFPLEFDVHKLQQLVPSICLPPLRGLLMEANLLDHKSSDNIVLQFRMIQTFLTELPSNKVAKDVNESASVLPVIREKTMAEGDDLYNFILEEALWPAMVSLVNVEWQVKTAPSECIDVFLRFRPHLSNGEFFPKWLKVLRKWVLGSPNLIELEKWYCGWKLFFDKSELAENERLLVHFHGALVLLQAATESVGKPAESRPPVPELNGSAAANYQDALAYERDEEVNDPPVREEKMSPRSVSRTISLKDVIENMAISHNLTFMPKGFHDGQQVYKFGKHHIIIEQGVVFVEESKESFKPVDLDQLL